MKTVIFFAAFLLAIPSISTTEEVKQDLSFTEQLKMVEAYIKGNSLVLKKGVFKDTSTGIIEALLSLDTDKC